jgi:hypothetical protein
LAITVLIWQLNCLLGDFLLTGRETTLFTWRLSIAKALEYLINTVHSTF